MTIDKIHKLFDLSPEQIPAKITKVCRLSVDEYKKHHKFRSGIAENLADDIFVLANEERVIDLDAYINTFNQALFDRSSEDIKFILSYAQIYFEKKYEIKIKKLGESTKLYDQMIKRTGRESGNTIKKILEGFQVEPLVDRLIDPDLADKPAEQHALLEELENLGPKQFAETYWTIKRRSAQEIATFMQQCLSDTPDLMSLKILLQTKTRLEIDVIISEYEEMFLFKEGSPQVNFKEWLLTKYEALNSSDIFEEILDGLNYKTIASRINWVFQNLDPLWIDFYQNQSESGLFSFPVFRSSSELSGIGLELQARPFILALTYYLEIDQFTAVKDILEKNFGLKLTEELYNLDWNDSACKSFFKLEKSLSLFTALAKEQATITLKDYLSCVLHLKPDVSKLDYDPAYARILAGLIPLYLLDHEQIDAFRPVFKILANKSLEELLEEQIEKIFPGEIPDTIRNLSTCLANGLQHQVAEHVPSNFFKASKTNSKKRESLAKLNAILANPGTADTMATNIAEQLYKFSPKQLSNLVEDFHRQYKVNILAKIKQLLSPSDALLINKLIGGFNPRLIAQELPEANNYYKLLNYDPVEIALIDRELSLISGNNLLSFLEAKLTESEHPALTLAPAFFPLISQYKQRLVDQENWDESESKHFFETFRDQKLQLDAMELAYDILFTSWETGLEYSSGTWRTTLQSQTCSDTIAPDLLVETISLSEELPIKLISDIHELVASEKYPKDYRFKLNDLLRVHKEKLPIIKMLFLLFDRNKSLREYIYDFPELNRDENFTLLLLDGHDAEKLAGLINQQVEKLEGPKLAKAVWKLLDPSTSEYIPKAVNWRGEMFHQVRIRYEENYGKDLVSSLLLKGVPYQGNKGAGSITKLLYGKMASKAVAVYKLLNAGDQKTIDKALLKRITTFKPSQIERIKHMYQAYFNQDLLTDLRSKASDPALLKLIEKTIEDADHWEEAKLAEKLGTN